jgi:small subunit ribosomal protein S36
VTDDQRTNAAATASSVTAPAVTAQADDVRSDGQTAPGAPAGPHRTRVPRIVWWIVALHVTVLGAYSILLPTYRAPDEPLHVDLAHHWSTDFDYPAWDDRSTADGVINSLFLVRFPGRAAHLTAEEATPKDERPSYEDLDKTPSVGGFNQLPQHPPLYYAVAGTVERAAEVVIGDPDFQVETWFYRLVSIAMVAPLPFLIWKAARVIALPEPVTVAAMLIPLAIPQYLHIGASVNNDNLQYLATWLLTPIALRVARGDLTTRTMVLAGAVTGIGLFAKAFSFVIPVWMGCALALALVRLGRAALPRVVRAGLVYSVPAMLLGGWWWVRNVVVYGSLMPTRYFDMVQPVPRGDLHIVDYLNKWITGTIRRFWGDFGYFDTRIPFTAVTVATTVSVVLLLVALVGRDRVADTRLGDRLLLFAPLVLLMAMQLQTALGTYLENGQYAALQGRYWFGALAPLAILLALGAAKLLRSFQRWLPLGVLAAAAVMQGLALSAIFGFYWGAPGAAFSARLRAMIAWAPVPGEVIALAATAGALIGVAAAVEIVRLVLRDRGDGVAGTSPLQPTATSA